MDMATGMESIANVLQYQHVVEYILFPSALLQGPRLMLRLETIGPGFDAFLTGSQTIGKLSVLPVVHKLFIQSQKQTKDSWAADLANE